MVFDNSLVTGNHDIYAMTHLQAYYDRILSKIVSIVQESVEVETKPIQLVTKILPIMEHCVSTAFEVSKEFCCGRRTTLSVTSPGQCGYDEHM